MAIAALAVWAFTVAAGAYLLSHVIAAKRTAGGREAASRGVPEREPAATPWPAQAPGPAKPPPIPRTKVYAGPDDHPLREFSHPALALCGLGFWGAFVATNDLGFAWIGCGVLAVTAGIGLSWLVSNLRASRRRGGGNDSGGNGGGGNGNDGDAGDGGGPGVPAHLVAIHGLAAATTVMLVLFALVIAARA